MTTRKWRLAAFLVLAVGLVSGSASNSGSFLEFGSAEPIEIEWAENDQSHGVPIKAKPGQSTQAYDHHPHRYHRYKYHRHHHRYPAPEHPLQDRKRWLSQESCSPSTSSNSASDTGDTKSSTSESLLLKDLNVSSSAPIKIPIRFDHHRRDERRRARRGKGKTKEGLPGRRLPLNEEAFHITPPRKGITKRTKRRKSSHSNGSGSGTDSGSASSNGWTPEPTHGSSAIEELQFTFFDDATTESKKEDT